MEKAIAILQSNYIPWKGYFDIIRQVDEFIILDSVQYTKNDWRNRNLIKTRDGLKWLSIPVNHKINQKIKDVRVSDSLWNIKHWKSIKQYYSKTDFYLQYHSFFEELYMKRNESFLSEINYIFITEINKLLNINTKISWCSQYEIVEEKTEKLISICKQSGAKKYLTGPSAINYIKSERFIQEGIELCWMDYSHYPEYKQQFGTFSHNTSIIDLIFNVGPKANEYITRVT